MTTKNRLVISAIIKPALCGLLLAINVASVGAQQKSLDSAAPENAKPALELVVLGSGGPGAVGRAGASFAVLMDGTARILVDSGPGSFVRAGEEKIALRQLDIVLLTHLHVDHVGELPGIVKARAVANSMPINFRIFGPAGAAPYPSTRALIDTLFGAQGAFGYLANFAAPVHFDTRNVEASAPPSVQVLLEENGLKISAIGGHHRDAPALIYRIDYRGHSVTFSGDIDAEGWPSLKKIAQDTDLLVFNTVVLDPPGSPEQLYALHTPPMMIGKLAHQVGARRLLLAHLNPAIDQAHDAVLQSITASFDRPVIFASDRLRLRF